MNSIAVLFVSGFQIIRSSRLAKILLLIVLIKFLFFFGFLKNFLYPRYLEPNYESEQQQSEEVIRDLTTTHNSSEQ